MIALAALLAAIVTSPAPEHVALTVYRDPGRTAKQAMRLGDLSGFALVTETRRVTVPAGEAVLRFEGVADGIVPVSAVVDGLPGGTIEKNRDARLLSPASLVDGTLGREVTLRRTDRGSGAVREERATIVAGPSNGVVLRTASGIETLGCAGLPEKMLYDGIPADLSAKPTLSVTTRSPRAATVTVTLSYLAESFDWSASYVATIAPDGKTLDLFAWGTLANGNAQAFANADVQMVAGRLERRAMERYHGDASRLSLRCYPLGTTTSDLSTGEDIVVTAGRSFDRMAAPMMAMAPPPPPPPPPEDLGDLKLYRVPEAVTVSPNAQKQVRLLIQPRVAFERVYRFRLMQGQEASAMPATIGLRLRNEAAQGLGIPLPAGSTALYQARPDGKLMVGLGTIRDTANGERKTIDAGISRQVTAGQVRLEERRMRLTITNANPFAVTIEVPIGGAGDEPLVTPSAPVPRIDGVQTWRTRIAANGSAVLGYGYR